MRVISGKLRGRVIKAVPGSNTRPTADKIKESSFQIMGPYFDGGMCLDLFAGSGNLGIEALSRGMNKCIFIDHNYKAIQTIKQNIKNVHLTDYTEIYRTNALKALHILNKRELRFDLIFIDPPYQKVDYNKVINNLLKYNLLNNHCLVYCEHAPDEQIHSVSEHLEVIREITYSKTIAITILQYHNDERKDL